MTPRMTMSLVIRGPPAVAAASGFIRSFSAYVRFGPPAPDAGAGGWATCARGCRPLLTEMLLQPAIDRVVPQDAVGRLEHPVVLVGEVEELRLDALALQRGERGDALRDRDAVVELAVHHQHRHAPVLDVVDRVEALVAFRVVVRRATVLPLAEPQLLGGVAHDAVVEHAVVVDQALPRAGFGRVPVAGDPVHHVAAVAGTQRAGVGAIEVVVLL